MDTKTTASAASELIDKLGGTTEVARLCDIRPPSVSEWRRKGIPKPWMKFLELARPDAFPIVERRSGPDRRSGGDRRKADRRAEAA